MITQRVVWTLIPNGLTENGRARASVLISPRLQLTAGETPSELSQFPAWEDWPSVIQASSFTVSAGGQSLQADLVSATDSSIWRALFPLTTYVEPWSFDRDAVVNRAILSYPTTLITDLIERVYGEVGANQPDDLPDREVIAAELATRDREGAGSLAALPQRGIRPSRLDPAEVLDAIRREKREFRSPQLRDPKVYADAGIMADPDHALDLLETYHTPLNTIVDAGYEDGQAPDGYAAKFPGQPNPMRHAKWKTAERAALASPADFREEIDFHRIVAAVAQYPSLNRLCGLALELEFDRPSAGPQATLELGVSWPTGSTNTEPDITPSIVTQNSGSRFQPAKRFPVTPIEDGFLRFSDSDFRLIQMDVDGGGMKLKNFAQSLAVPIRAQFDDEEAGPAGDSKAGLPSLRTGGIMLAERRRDLSLSFLLDRAAEMQSDLTGSGDAPTLYAEDVVRGYRFDIKDVADGRWRSLFERVSRFDFVNGAHEPVTNQEEGMARATGGGSTDGNNADILKLHEGIASWSGWSLAAPEPGRLIYDDDSFGDEREDTPDGLPLRTEHRPRPGSLPRLRFGHTYQMRVRLVNLAGTSIAPDTNDIQPQTAASEPVMFRRLEPVDPPAIALVSENGLHDPVEDGESMSRLAIRTFNDTPDKNTIAIGDQARRHLMAPRVSHRFAELHGVVDTGPGGRPDPSLYPILTAKDSPLDEVEIQRNKPNHPGGMSETYAVAEDGFELPFLPDPLAVEAILIIKGVTGINPSRRFRVPLYPGGASWPNAAPFKIVLIEDPGRNPEFRDVPREFIIPLDKADRARVEISCRVPADKVSMMAVWDMISRRGANAATRSQLLDKVRDARHWMITPWRIVELVHAVQKPLILPVMPNLSIGRSIGSKEARPGVEGLPLECRSTARTDMECRWSEPDDDPANLNAADGPIVKEGGGHAFKKEFARTEHPGGVVSYYTGEHDLPDTRARRMFYQVKATTRFREFMPENIRTDAEEISITGPERMEWADNTAPPPPPDVLYVIPTFGWARTESDGSQRSTRLGAGLRVYLDRPWMASGFPEMLGVVMRTSQRTPVNVPPDMRTQWGQDPLWQNAGPVPTASPPLSAFPLMKTSGGLSFPGTDIDDVEGSGLGSYQHTGLPLPGTATANNTNPPRALDVAPHQVGYDPERKLWYADIVVRPPGQSFFPFIRLALSRYNPVSVWGAHLSRPVMTEFQQLVPDRLVIVTPTRRGGAVRVRVHGVGPAAPARGRSAHQFEAVTEVLDAGQDPDLGWRAVEADLPSDPTRLQLQRPRAQINPQVVQRRGAETPQRAQIARDTLERIVQSGNTQELTLNPDLVLQAMPPLLWETEIGLPDTPNGGQRRVLVMEHELHRREPDDRTRVGGQEQARTTAAPLPGSRIIYMDAFEV
jgi:hypothetical protein